MSKKHSFDIDISLKNSLIAKLNKASKLVRLPDCGVRLSVAAERLGEVSSLNVETSKIIYEELDKALDKLIRLSSGIVDYDIKKQTDTVCELVKSREMLL